MKKTLILKSLILSVCVTTIYAGTPSISSLVSFLTSDALLRENKAGHSIPLSYYIGKSEAVARYFGDFICQADNSCEVTDSVYDDPFAILGKGLPPYQGTEQQIKSANAQLERIDMAHGADIYDAATWQIALALSAKNGYLEKDKARLLVENQNERLQNESNRATSDSFKYGYAKTITDPHKAFTFRMVTKTFILKDPFYDTRYKDSITWDYSPEEMASHSPGSKPSDFKYVTTWSDWKPITGENAWAQLIGPIQAELLLNKGKLSSDSKALKNAINSLYAFSAMQSSIGGIYYAPGGSLGNTGQIPKGEISIENNFSVLGGLQVLKGTLAHIPPSHQTRDALQAIDVLLNGGQTVSGFHTEGLLHFFYHHAFNQGQGIFYTHGIAPIPTDPNSWQADDSQDAAALAVDVNTWGIAALGPETIDHWYGKQTALSIWMQVRKRGGYFDKEGKLLGLGYTLQNDKDQIMSTEWTAGAVNALNLMVPYYEKQGMDVTSLKNDLISMKLGMEKLRSDNYLGQGFDHETPQPFFTPVEKQYGVAYLYASKRFAIPFGWYANTLASTTSTAWVIMNRLNFNPFQYQGKMVGEHYPIPSECMMKAALIDNLKRDVVKSVR